jgi:predicted oxidoreductase
VLNFAPFIDGDIAWMQERAIHPMAWSPLGGGRLFTDEGGAVRAVLDRVAAEQGVDATAVAVAWLLAHPAKLAPVMGTNNLSRIRTISDADKVEIDRQTWFEILTAAMGHEVP